jgi:N-acetyl-anhydromuramoyl-L-alanine amidase
LKLGAQGWFSGVRRVMSPNYDARPSHMPIRLLIIHSISLPPDEFGGDDVRRLFTNTLNPEDHPYYEQLRGLKVSSHFFIRRNGEIVQFVSCLHRAWHAGQSLWQGRTRCNDFSIGIEMEGSDFVPFDELQYRSLAKLTRRLQRAYRFSGIVGHEDVAPGRKTDPGPFFDWERYLKSL